ncbi:nucleolar and coiled-body phosphoprotein 1-like [Tigriopus californicus]|uniref:nucleolar and coiled-body phosphoprotein 1-like n=1 Tax=Tigriopus californicus TaxID=6832 RepID=UPI0027DA4C07|nr:nucleolar and coiled-body phosphoprotein 1-like [Tigriopus californicus]
MHALCTTMNMNPNDTFEITGNDRFKAKASAVFAFDQVTLRSTATPSDPGHPPASTPATKDSTNTPCVLRPDAPHLAGHASDPAGAKRVRTDDFKGRESLFRVPDHEWDRPRERETLANEALDLRRILERRQNSRTRGGHSDPHPRETFRRPANPRPRAPRSHHGVPDFKRNPDKYQKYTLKDVDLTSNRGNSQAAFAFLDEIKKRKRKSDDHFDAEENEQERQMRESGQIQFKPRCSQKSSSTPSPSSSLSADSSSTSSESQRARASSSSTGREAKKHKPTTMMLSHLMQDEEEEEEEEEEEDGEGED